VSEGSFGRADPGGSPPWSLATACWLAAALAASVAVVAELIRRPDRYFVSGVVSFDLMLVAAVLALVAAVVDRQRTPARVAGTAGTALAVVAFAARVGNGPTIASVRIVVLLELLAAILLALPSAAGIRVGWPRLVPWALRSVGSMAAAWALAIVLADRWAGPLVIEAREVEIVGLLLVAGIGLVGGAREERWPVALAWLVGVVIRRWSGADGAEVLWLAPLALATVVAWAPRRLRRAARGSAEAGAARLGAGIRSAGRRIRLAVGRVWGALRREPSASVHTVPTRSWADLGVRGRWLAGVLGGAAVVVVAWTVVHGRRVGWYPIGDDAIIATRAGDVGGGHTPLVGMPTTLGPSGPQGLEIHHPGPLQFWLTAPFVRLLGPAVGVMAAAAAIWLAALGATVWAAFRARGAGAALLAYGAALVVALTAASGVPFEPLNAHVPILPLFATYVLAWAAMSGVRWALVWAVGLGSLCMQSYVPVAPAAAVAILVAGVTVLVPRARLAGSGRPRRVLLAATGLGLLVWSGPILDAAANQGGNIRMLLRTEHARVATVGPGGAARALLGLISVPPTWLSPGPFRVDDASTYLDRGVVAGLVVLAGTLGVVIWRWSSWDRGLRRLVALASIGLLVGAGTLARLPAQFVFVYQVWWVGAVGVVAWFTVAVVVSDELARLRSWPSGVALGTRVALVSAVAVLLLAIAWPRDLAYYSQVAAGSQRAAQDLADELGSGPGKGRPIAVLADGRSWEQVIANGLAMSLAAHGRDIRVTPLLGEHWGTFRLEPQDPSDPVLIVSDGFSPGGPGVGRPIARFEPEGWSEEAADATAARVAGWARRHGPIVTRLGFGGIKRSVVHGWDPDLTCSELDELKLGQRTLDSLPDGAIAQLYLEGVVVEPALPPDLFEAVKADLLATPTEVWLADAAEAQGAIDGPIAQPCT